MKFKEVSGQDVLDTVTLAGFDLCGWRLPDGRIRADRCVYLETDEYIVFDKFPEEIHLMGNTYSLEYTKDGATNEQGETWVNAIYV